MVGMSVALRVRVNMSGRRLTYPLFPALLFVLVSIVPLQARQSQDNRQAKLLWEQVIAAKGGREALYRVDSMVMSYQETTRNFLGVAVHRGIVETLYVFPDRSWSWDDGLTSPFHLTVGWLDLERNRRCTIYAGTSAPVCGPAKQGNLNEGISQVQYLYLMETRWVKPLPLSVTNGSIGLKKVDVLHTGFENKNIDYFLNRKTHLPLRVAVFYHGSDRATLIIDLSDYVTVSGIQMPGKQKKTPINFQINPPYDAGIFTRPPSVSAGPHAWQQVSKEEGSVR